MTASPLKDWQSFLKAKITGLIHQPQNNAQSCLWLWLLYQYPMALAKRGLLSSARMA